MTEPTARPAVSLNLAGEAIIAAAEAAATEAPAPAGPPAGHVQMPGTKWTPSDPQQVVDPAAFAAGKAEHRRAATREQNAVDAVPADAGAEGAPTEYEAGKQAKARSARRPSKAAQGAAASRDDLAKAAASRREALIAEQVAKRVAKEAAATAKADKAAKAKEAAAEKRAKAAEAKAAAPAPARRRRAAATSSEDAMIAQATPAKAAEAKPAGTGRAAPRSLTRHLEQLVESGQVVKGQTYPLGQLAKMESAEYAGAKVSTGALVGRVGTPGKELAGWTAVLGKPLSARYDGVA